MSEQPSEYGDIWSEEVVLSVDLALTIGSRLWLNSFYTCNSTYSEVHWNEFYVVFFYLDK